MRKILLEAPVYTLEAALLAAEYGVDRLELCADFGEGGTTPSAGMLSYLKSKVQVPVFVMIRPRGGDFVYSKEELEVMKEDVNFFKTLGADGFVFGVLQKNGKVDGKACAELISAAEGIPCTFHRAFDASDNLEDALETVIDCGFDRILTSGGKNTVGAGLDRIKRLLGKAADRITVIPGGGTLPEHLAELYGTGYLKEIHASCKTFRPSQSTFSNPELRLSKAGDSSSGILTVDEKIVNTFQKEILRLKAESRPG